VGLTKQSAIIGISEIPNRLSRLFRSKCMMTQSFTHRLSFTPHIIFILLLYVIINIGNLALVVVVVVLFFLLRDTL